MSSHEVKYDKTQRWVYMIIAMIFGAIAIETFVFLIGIACAAAFNKPLWEVIYYLCSWPSLVLALITSAAICLKSYLLKKIDGC